MRKRLLSILLSVLLCLALVSPQAAAADIYFVAVDDSVPLTLPSSMSPFFSGSTLYVPSSVFEAAPGGVTPSYNASGQTLVLFRSGARLIFNLANGTVTDEDKNSSNISTVSKNGTIYLPLYFCTSHFGLSVTTLNSAEGYPILRFTTGSEVYDDAMFVEKAEKSHHLSGRAVRLRHAIRSEHERRRGGPARGRGAARLRLLLSGH